MSDESKPKIGAGHAKAILNLGLNELRGLVYPESNVAQPLEYGIFGKPTPGEIADGRRESGREMEGEGQPSVLAEREADIQSRARGEDRQPSREMERE